MPIFFCNFFCVLLTPTPADFRAITAWRMAIHPDSTNNIEGFDCQVRSRSSEGPACRVRGSRLDYPSRVIGRDKHGPPIGRNGRTPPNCLSPYHTNWVDVQTVVQIGNLRYLGHVSVTAVLGMPVQCRLTPDRRSGILNQSPRQVSCRQLCKVDSRFAQVVWIISGTA